MGRFVILLLVASTLLLSVPTPAAARCEEGPPGIRQVGEGPQVGSVHIGGMTVTIPRTEATAVRYVVVDGVQHTLEFWTESNTWADLQRGNDCKVQSGFLWPDTLDQRLLL